jgi:enoyl-CoA hydratase
MATIVDYRLADRIATITMDDGKKNALSPDMFAQLNAALDRAETDRAVVVLTGREGVLSGGFDLRVLGGGGPTAVGMVRTGFDLGLRLLSFPAPVVVACPGHAIAMGAFLLLSGDHRIGAEGAFRVGANEVAIGITMPFFGIEMCRQRLTPAYFHRSVINAEIYSPDGAVAAGFLDRLVPADALADAARQTALDLAKLDTAVHTATKLRARAGMLQAVRAAIDADAGEGFGGMATA